MHIKISRSQWETMGKATGWDKLAVGRNMAPEVLDYVRQVDALLKAHYGIDSGDTSLELISSCQRNGETPEECVDRIGEKYGLERVGGSRPKGVKTASDGEDAAEPERLSFSMGTTPEEVVRERVKSQTPSGYPMHIKSQREWSVIAKAVNQGIDSHLEGFTRSKFDPRTGKCLVHPEEMTTLLRRLHESGDEESWNLRGSILETLGVEEI